MARRAALLPALLLLLEARPPAVAAAAAFAAPRPASLRLGPGGGESYGGRGGSDPRGRVRRLDRRPRLGGLGEGRSRRPGLPLARRADDGAGDPALKGGRDGEGSEEEAGRRSGGEAEEEAGGGAAQGRDRPPPPRLTISGGTSTIMEMARRMLVWDDELYARDAMLNDASAPREEWGGSSESGGESSGSPYLAPRPADGPLPRWRPPSIRPGCVSNANPSFRSAPPVMSNGGYASVIRRNSRKRARAMREHALRVYGRMERLEAEQAGEDAEENDGNEENGGRNGERGGIPGVGGYLTTLQAGGTRPSDPPAGEPGAGRAQDEAVGGAPRGGARGGGQARAVGGGAADLRGGREGGGRGRRTRRGPGRRGEEEADGVLSSFGLAGRGHGPLVEVEEEAADVEAAGGGEEVNEISTNSTEAGERGNSTTASELELTRPQLRRVARLRTVDERRRPLDAAAAVLGGLEGAHGISAPAAPRQPARGGVPPPRPPVRRRPSRRGKPRGEEAAGGAVQAAAKGRAEGRRRVGVGGATRFEEGGGERAPPRAEREGRRDPLDPRGGGRARRGLGRRRGRAQEDAGRGAPRGVEGPEVVGREGSGPVGPDRVEDTGRLAVTISGRERRRQAETWRAVQISSSR
ncbi:hypothetical protein THAOC_31034 [Thalassiosira oceanica]|uniref:Uncharacterized protein n=1 Tax=Thalassiosira oceanica TaxID=159749 RepID=K0RCN5_THAOC|nr:hypothetical protein THAOC_31034 [Thalassiosira oceanica]|eukprot:EJK50034.1 hypothetical protein THAOC_31034 [Thalassiosira oceanica]